MKKRDVNMINEALRSLKKAPLTLQEAFKKTRERERAALQKRMDHSKNNGGFPNL